MKYRLSRDGHFLSDDLSQYIFSAAERGLMTKAAKDLLVVPDTRCGRIDSSGLQHMKRVKKKDCRTLAKAYPKSAKTAL